MHAIESHRMAQDDQQMSAFAAAVQQQRQLEQQASGGQQAGEEGGGSSSAWRDILRLDPVAQKLRRSKLARIAFRRCGGREATAA